MDQPVKPFTSEGPETRKWIGRLIIAVLLGDALWDLIVSVVNNVFVPWLGDVMGPSAGLPTSFTQRPYNYPGLFVSIFEFCIAGLVAAILNYFFQRPTARKLKTVTAAPAEPIRVVPQVVPSPAMNPAPVQSGPFDALAPVAPQEPVARIYPVFPSVLSDPEIPVAPAAPVMSEPVVKPAAVVVPPTPAVAEPVAAKPLVPAPPTPKVSPAKPKKQKEVYYNIVGEPMPSDDD
jgi:hypothetical protein